MRRGKVIPLFKGPRPPEDPRGLKEVYRAGDQAEALVVKGLLESEGIYAVFRGRIVHSVHPFAAGDLGEVRILVPTPDADRARRLLERRSG